jgi:hypothetical protein
VGYKRTTLWIFEQYLWISVEQWSENCPVIPIKRVEVGSMLRFSGVDVMELPAETWGDRFHRAYRYARRREGGGLTYRKVASFVSNWEPTNDATIIRLEGMAAAPRSVKKQRIAVICLVRYGFDPGRFDLSESNHTPAEVLQLVPIVHEAVTRGDGAVVGTKGNAIDNWSDK